MYSRVLFSVVVGLAISFCGQIEGAPGGDPIKLVKEESEKQPLIPDENMADAPTALPKVLHQEEPEKRPLIRDETMADAPTALPEMVEEEREQKPKIETGSSNSQGLKEKGIQGDKDSLVRIPKIEQTEMQEERTIDEKIKEKGLPPKPKKEQTEIQIEGHTEDEKSEIKRIISRSSTLSRRNSRKLTDDQLQDWKEAFAYYDIDKNGQISADELETTLKKLGGFDGSIEDVKQMIEVVDRDNSGTIDFQEFLAMMSKRSNDELGELQRLFNAFDTNGDGFITADELKSCDLIDIEKVDAEIAAVDTNGDGKIDFIEFQAMLTRAGYYGAFSDENE